MAARASQAAFAGNEPKGRWAGARVAVGEHLLDLGMAAVMFLGLTIMNGESVKTAC
jgi:hypothetical protein